MIRIPFINNQLDNNAVKNIIGNVVPIVLIFPFLWAFMVRKPNINAFYELWGKAKYNMGPLLMFDIVRVVLGILILGFFLDRFASTQISFFITIPIVVILLFVFSKKLKSLYSMIEERFVSNLNSREIFQQQQKNRRLPQNNPEISSKLAAWDVHIVEMEVNPNAPYVGKELMDLKWREKYGVNIGYIQRGEKLIHSPARFEVLHPFDKVGIIATDEQFQKFKPVFDATELVNEADRSDIKLGKILINEKSSANGKTIRESGIRERTMGLVVAIRRGENRILNPESTEILLTDDIVFVVGDGRRIEELNVEI